MNYSSLSKQVHVHSVDTSAFYNEEESKIQEKLSEIVFTRNKHIKILSKIKNKTEEMYYYEIFSGYHTKKDSIPINNWHITADRELAISNLEFKKLVTNDLVEVIEQLNQDERLIKKDLKALFPMHTGTRILKNEKMNKKTRISVFETSLTRTLGIETGTISEDIIIVQKYYDDILEDLVLDNFIYNDEVYIYFTASAGQIRTKKNVFIRESVWKEHKDTITCGLSIEMINKKEGANVNKYLAYLALSNSATDKWDSFKIDNAIVVNDMEFSISTIVDYINNNTYEITPKIKMDVPINHTDGCGMILPRKSKKSFMVRMPWVKGLLVPFKFDDYILKENAKFKECGIDRNCGLIKDIYGKEWDIIKDGIEVIFTKSQFKMHKYFNSWEEYKEKFKLHKCEASKCNEEDGAFSNVKIGYQMLQSLSDMSDKELQSISEKSRNSLKNIGNDRETMLKVLGVTESNKEKNYLQQALEIYPELLRDTHCKEVLKDVKKSLFNSSRAGKLEVAGKYTFIIPDLFAFCEWTFLSDKNPKGLLCDGEVFCKLFPNEKKLDVLRSPHLFREHAVRSNKVDRLKKKWFITNGIYTSVYDNISKLLQFDVDGDKSIVISEDLFVEIADRNMKNDNIVPLYYEMGVAKPEQLNNQSIYNGLKNAYTGGNIGEVSNNISKVWNSENINLDVIRWLCMENNFVIDYAKTLFKPKRPPHIDKLIKEYTGNKVKLPHFFIYAKEKEEMNVQVINDSVVNRLEKMIPKTKMNFNAANLGKFRFELLMNNRNIELDQDIINTYIELDLKKRKMSNEIFSDGIESSDSLYIYRNIRNQILSINSDKNYVVDVLIKYLYQEKNSDHKTTLWSSFGDIILNNLHRNIKRKFENGYLQCNSCGERFMPNKQRQDNCESCQDKIKREKAKIRKEKFINKE